MKTKIFASAFIFALFVLLTPYSAFACAFEEDGAALRCNLRPRSATPATLLAASVPPPALKIPSGSSPFEARDVPNEWQLMEPRASIWYKTNYSNSFRLLEYWLETNRADALSFAVYAPQQSEGLAAATKPIGRGTHSKSDPDTTIRWRAGYAWPGIWYLLLTNNTDQPVSFKLNHNQESISAKNCISYWEDIKGVPTYWTDCGLHTGPH